MTSEKTPGKFPGKIPGKRPEEIPIPSCKNTNRKTYKCRRMCCRRQDDRVAEDDASGVQTRIDMSGSPRQQLLSWFNRDR